MFGYVKTDNPNLYIKDYFLYKSLYCGLCKGIKNCCGNCGRLTLSYDLTFLSAFLHNVMNIDVKVEKKHCPTHIIRKTTVAIPDELTKTIGALNVILAFYKVKDDILDSKKGKVKLSILNKSYKRAKKLHPNFDKIIKENFDNLIKLEGEKSDSIDIVSDCFGSLVRDVSNEILKEFSNEYILNVCYNIGKWIYLIDALDDFDKDKKKNNFNVFINLYSDIKSKEQLLKDKKEELFYIFGGIFSLIKINNDNIKYNFNHDLIDNILLKGIETTTKNILENKKCKKTTKL